MRGAAGAVSSVVGGGQGRALVRQEKPPCPRTPVQVHCGQGLEYCSFQLSTLWSAKAPTGLWQSADHPKSGHQRDRPASSPSQDHLHWQTGLSKVPREANRSCLASGSTQSSPFSCTVPMEGHSSALYLPRPSPTLPYPCLLISLKAFAAPEGEFPHTMIHRPTACICHPNLSRAQ